MALKSRDSTNLEAKESGCLPELQVATFPVKEFKSSKASKYPNLQFESVLECIEVFWNAYRHPGA